ncbi:TonB-dependent receptor [Rhizomicrobium electricum]|uniref:TonB-dependent receptor n=2 Tax=Rhizomicrobium electricum TaxID=480070 RepID=A0ABP3P8A6_9PROT
METVVITGSRIAVQTAYDAPTPVTVVGAQDIQLSGTVNVENLLQQSPQFLPSTNGGSTGNTVQANGDSGAAWLNLRGLGEVRNLVLVNGRRFAIQGTRLTTDINTIPATLIQRTEVVTGGNSAVYGSDAISGVVNFVMKQDFEGVQAGAQYMFDQFTVSPTYNFDVTMGGNFDHDKGNLVMALNYMSRKGFTQPDHGGWTNVQYTDSCVTSGTYSTNAPGTRQFYTDPQTGATTSNVGANCVAAGGLNGFTTGGSGDTPNGYIKSMTTYANASPALQALYATAGLTKMTGDGFIFTNTGAATPGTYRLRDANTDVYNLIATNYMQVPNQRWMLNTFGHYDFNKYVKAYAEFHFSSNTVTAQLTPSSMGSQMLFNTHNPAFSPALQAVMDYLDQHETGTSTITAGTATYTNAPNDGRVALTAGKRYVENGMRRQVANRVAWRFAGGFKGEIGSVSDSFLKDLSYDFYYTYSRTQETDNQSGSLSKSKIQANVLASTNGGTPLCDLFGLGALSQACVNAITVNSTVGTIAEMQDANLSFTGTAFDLPAGPVQFALGGEWRYTMARYTPDMYTASGDVAGLNAALPTSGAMVSHEIYGEVRVPVLKDLPLIDSFSVNSAFRYSDYNLNAAKGIWTWSFGADWRIIPDVTVRGQYQRATRAPNVGELWGGSASNTSPTLNDPCGAKSATQTAAVRALCVAQGVADANVFTSAVQGNSDLVRYASGGNPNLKPETADTITLGVVFQPEALPGLATSIDFYSIQVKDMIGALAGGAGGVLDRCFSQTDPNNLYCQQIHRVNGALVGGTGYVNAANANIAGSKTQGFDLNAQYSFDVDYGLFGSKSKVDVGTAWNWTLELVSLPDITQPNVKSNCAGAYGNTYCYYEPTPRMKSTTHVTWNDGPLTLNLKMRFIDSVMLDKYLVPLRRGATGLSPVNYVRPKLPAMYYFDLAASYDVNDNIQVYGGINNLFSKDPPILGSAASYANSFPATYDALGRVTFIGIKAKTN